jgi:hypothetical protein
MKGYVTMKEYQITPNNARLQAPTRQPRGDTPNYRIGFTELSPAYEERLFITDQGTELSLTTIRCACFEIVTMEPVEGGRQ